MAQAADQIVVEVTAVVGPYNQAMVQVAAVTTRNMAAAEDAAKKSSDGIGKALETAASRVPGLVKGLVEGRSALELFLGEAAEFLPIFGTWGTVLGAAATVLETLLTNVDLFGESAEAAGIRAAASFDKVGNSLRGVLDDMQISGLGLDDFGKKSKQAMDDLQAAATENATAMQRLQDKIAADSFGIRGGSIGARIREGAGDATDREIFALMEEINSKAPVSAERLREIRQRLDELGAQAISGKDDVAVFTTAIDQNIGSVDALEKQATALKLAIELVEKAQKSAADAAYGFGDGLVYAADRAGFLRNAVDAFRDLRASMLPKTGLSFGGQSVTFATRDLQSAFIELMRQYSSDKDPAGFEIPSRPGTGVRRSSASRAVQSDADKAQGAMLEDAGRLYEQTLTPLEKYFQAETKAMALKPALIALLGDEKAAQEVVVRAIVQAGEAYEKTADKAEDAKARQKEVGDAISAVGDVFKDGIKGAKDFNDALDKIGLGLLDLVAKGLFGQGALGGVFNQIFGAVSGGAGILGPFPKPIDQPSAGGGGLATLIGSGLSWLGGLFGGGLAGGGQALPGRLYQVGEAGREWFAPSVPGQVIPNHVIKAAAGGGNGSGPPINFNISLAGANGDRTIAEIAAAAVKKGLAQVPEINRQHRIRFA
ncbi:hypothetical protein [Inquilinus limosus]|uniref:Bacteriophage tail tape measure C-terminal domain-containing protein n=1 Tax=Inquilinus limosus TaxID=171674 RepID=A0A211ZTX2_9PROT|nr:hypothetical protein [Inquilinus limosus]OWJ68703.1 hypothetical protein BWR60_02845 [Inquilinus limosus]